MSRSSRLTIALALGMVMILMLALAIIFVKGVGVVLAEDQPDGSIIISPQTTNGTWGPGTITAETDVVINAGVIITIAPGTTIRVADRGSRGQMTHGKSWKRSCNGKMLLAGGTTPKDGVEDSS